MTACNIFFFLSSSSNTLTPFELLALTADDWHNLTPERYKELFKHSAMERAGYEGLMRNITRHS